jgi:Skp family chaperone for outer membrane proteins
MRAFLPAAGLIALAVMTWAFGGADATAQSTGTEEPAAQPSPILILDQDRLFQQSAWGKAAIAMAEAESAALASENRKIEQALEKEERDLTEKRASMNAAEFAAVSSAFDVKVEGIRNAQDAKSRAIGEKLEADRQQFFQIATPILGALLEETGAVAIVADSAIILSRISIDATDLAIVRVDLALPAPIPPEKAPQVAPQSNP